jgi:putative endonuclease
MTQSIRKYIPFEVVYFEEFEKGEEAIAREKYFKTAAGRRFLKKKLDGDRMEDSGSSDLGSLPD